MYTYFKEYCLHYVIQIETRKGNCYPQCDINVYSN